MASRDKPNTSSHVTMSVTGSGTAAFYRLTHVRSGSFYIGSTTNMEQRRWDHLKRLNANQHPNHRLQGLFSVGDHLHFDIEYTKDRQAAYDKELSEIQRLRSDPLLLNILVDSVLGYAKGHVPTEETRAKIASRRGEDHHMYGKHFTEEHRQNLSNSLKGRVIKPESVEQMKKNRLGKASGAENPKSIEISIGGVIYPSINIASKELGVSETTIRKRLKSTTFRFADWKRLDQE
jgi:group I intron endonuclease